MGGKSKDKRQARPVVTDVSAVEISGAYWVTRSYAEVGDLISEGPIEGIVSGDYSYRATENKTGYDSVTFSQYSATGAAGGSALPELGFLRSIYWNKVPIVDKHGYYNFQDINVEHNFGDPIGALPTLSANLGDGRDFDLTVERGIGERLFGPQVKGYDKTADKDYSPGRQGEENSQPAILEGAIDRYAKTYSIYNKECSDLQVNIKVDALFEQVLAGKKLFEDDSELKPCNEADVGYGDTKARTIEYNIYYMPLFDERFNPAREDADQEEGAFTDMWTLAVAKGQTSTERVRGKVDFPYIRTTTINVNSSFKDTPGFQGWKIRIVRLTPESLTSFLTNRTSVHSIVEVYGTRLRYPYTSMVYSRFDAKNFQQVPARSYDTKLLRVKVPSNYNPVCKTYGNSDAANDSTGQKTGATYNANKWIAAATITNGIFWDGEFKKDTDGGYIREWTDNPAWCFYDLITNPRYGLGEYIKETDVDKWALYEIAQYCDGMVPDGFGSYEPRFSMNYIITSREEAFKVLNDLSSMFRGITYYAHGSIFAIQDKYKDPVFQFNNSNVAQGDFTYSSSSKKARHSVAIIRYNDKRDNFQPAVEYMEDEESVRKYGILELETTALGCTSKGQARRFGKWILASEAEETETVQFGIGHEGGLIRPGDVVQIYDNFRSPLKRSGRTNAVIPNSTTTYFGTGANTVTGNSIILDSAVDFTSNKSYNFALLTPTFSYNATQITGLNSSGVNEISRSQIQNLVFSGAHARVITGSYKSEYYEGGSGVCTQIHFSTGEAFGGHSNQLNFDDYVITGYTNTGVDTAYGPTNPASVADYSGGCFSGENLIWSVEPSNSEDAEFVSGSFSNFRVINIKETDEHNYSVSALAYSTGKYDSVDSSVKLKDLTYYETPEFPTGDNNNLSAALLEFNTSLSLERDKPYQANVEDTRYESIQINFDKAGYNRKPTENDAGTFTTRVDTSDELTYFVSITTTGNPNQHTYATGNNASFLYTVPTSDYRDIYKPNTNLIITPEDTLYTDVLVDGRITAEILVTEKKDYYVTVFAANGAGRLSQGVQRKFDAPDNFVFFSAINHITVSNLTTQGITDTSTPETEKIQQDIGNGEPGFMWTPGFETSLSNAPVDNNEGPNGTDIPSYPLQMLENDVDWRVTFRAPSAPESPNVPSNVIYLEFTGYQSDPSFPSFVLTTVYNNPALISSLRSRNLVGDPEVTGYKDAGGGKTDDQEEVGYYLVDPSGMIVKNDLNAFPLRTFDIVVEPHDKAGKTSQDHYVWSNTIYNSDNKDDPVNLYKGKEQFDLSSVNSKYDIFGANIPSPSGIIFAPKDAATSNSTVLLGGENNSFIKPSKAYGKKYPYAASSLLLADGTFFIGIQPSESDEGSQILSDNQLSDIFGSSQGMVFYYTLGTSLKRASDFSIDTTKIPSYTQPALFSISDGSEAFGGIVRGVPANETVYRGFYVFGENDSLSRISLKIPQIADDKDNVNFCGALFDTLSMARAFTPETRRALPISTTNSTPLILIDADLKFNYRIGASVPIDYSVNAAGALPRQFEPNKPVEVKVFSMISQTQQCMSNQTWGQISFSLDDVMLGHDPNTARKLKDVLGYVPSTMTKDDDNYRFNREGGDTVISTRRGKQAEGEGVYPLDKVDMYKGHCYTLPMMLGNALARGFLNYGNNSEIKEIDDWSKPNTEMKGRYFKDFGYVNKDISSSAWFIMGFGDPRKDGANGLEGGTLSDEYFNLLKRRNVQGAAFTAASAIVEADAVETMRQLLSCIPEEGHEPTGLTAAVLAIAGFSPANQHKMYIDPTPMMEHMAGEGDHTVDNIQDVLQVESGYDTPGFYPFSQAWTKVVDGNPRGGVWAPITRTTYEFPINNSNIVANSVLQGVSRTITAKFKVFEVKMPDLTYMALNPGGSRSPTGWRVRHFAYMEFTVYGDFGNPQNYIVHPLEGYKAGERKKVTDPDDSSIVKTISYDSVEDFGTSSRIPTATKQLWSAEDGGLLLLPPTLAPRLVKKTADSFTFIIGAPANWTPDAHDGMELSDWFGTETVLQGKIVENSGLNLINFAVLKSNQ
tara:strand:+ start:9936 stop:16124 length:6189 start_codon:yes stop_codon:yes gene_type:complete